MTTDNTFTDTINELIQHNKAQIEVKDYWIGECIKKDKRIDKLEDIIKELEAELKDLKGDY